MTIDGCDISGVQGSIDFNKMATESAGGPDGEPMKFVYIQSSRFSSTVEFPFYKYKEQAKSAGLIAGAYHFSFQGSDPIAQMDFFFRSSEGLGQKAGELPPMIDWEFCRSIPTIECVQWLESALRRATELWYPDNAQRVLDGLRPRLPIVYTYPVFAGSHQPYLGQSSVGKYPLCFASYKNGPWYPKDGQLPVHPVPSPWSNTTIVQYSGNAGLPVPGVTARCDRDIFLGSTAEFEQFCGIYRPVDKIESQA